MFNMYACMYVLEGLSQSIALKTGPSLAICSGSKGKGTVFISYNFTYNFQNGELVEKGPPDLKNLLSKKALKK